MLDPGDRLSQNAYHYHENQTEFYYVVAGRCRVEVEDGSFTLNEDEVATFEPGVVHLIHNLFEKRCKIIAVGSPPEERYPVHQVRSYEEVLAKRYDIESGADEIP